MPEKTGAFATSFHLKIEDVKKYLIKVINLAFVSFGFCCS